MYIETRSNLLFLHSSSGHCRNGSNFSRRTVSTGSVAQPRAEYQGTYSLCSFATLVTQGSARRAESPMIILSEFIGCHRVYLFMALLFDWNISNCALAINSPHPMIIIGSPIPYSSHPQMCHFTSAFCSLFISLVWWIVVGRQFNDHCWWTKFVLIPCQCVCVCVL